jgi:TRAP-type C4-dicarboxylate transport system substrate-binding protein
MRPVALATLLVMLAPVAAADPIVLRMATIAPQGSGWAREFSAFGRDVENATDGAVRMKLYFSGIAGGDIEVVDRIRRDQLDGAIGSESCLHLGPSMKVTRIFGLFQSREESAYVLTRLKPILDAEFMKSGFINLGEATLGPDILFTRGPVRSMAELRKTTLWVWSLDEALNVQAPALGLRVVATPLEGATRAYDEHAVDGFVAVPSAALAFQWSAQARYLEDLRLSYREGCLFIATRAFDALPIEQQNAIRAAAGKLHARMEDLERRQDDELVGGLFSRQGLQTLAVDERFRGEFFELTRDMRMKLGQRLVSDQLMAQVQSWLADYRVMHSTR